MEIEFNHVTTEVTRYRIEIEERHKIHLESLNLDFNNPEHHDKIIEEIRDFNYDWIELSNDVVDGHFQDGTLCTDE